MLVLALDTSTPACAVALVDLATPGNTHSGPGGRSVSVNPLAARSTVDARRHGELLAPMISSVLATAAVEAAELAAVVVGTGPGPFTSLRVGMVSAAALAAALGLPAYGVCSLDGIGAATTGSVAAITDARRREVFWARYRDGVRLGDPHVGAPAEVAVELLAAGVERVTGPGVALYPQAFARFGAVPTEPPGGRHPDPETLVRQVADEVARGREPGPLLPLYLRRPDAAEPGAPKAVSAVSRVP